jgi:hypothetical protein
MNKFSILLQEMIDAGKDSTLSLDLKYWFCGTSCCACGDVVLERASLKELNREPMSVHSDFCLKANDVALELRYACRAIFNGSDKLANSIYMSTKTFRLEEARDSGLLTEKALSHPHLNMQHSDRKILHDYIRLVIEKSEQWSSLK